jgi:hypothetical protein
MTDYANDLCLIDIFGIGIKYCNFAALKNALN